MFPEILQAHELNISGRQDIDYLPAEMDVQRLNASDSTVSEVAEGLSFFELDLSGSLIETLPADLQVAFRLDLSRCEQLRELPDGLSVGTLILQNCTQLRALPEDLDTYFLDVTGCTNLMLWPDSAAVHAGRLVLRGCTQITELPASVRTLAQLDVSGCVNLHHLPDDLTVTGWIDVADNGLTELPASLKDVQIRWRGVLVDERIAFRPETITADEVLGESNVERRRVMLERMGVGRFLEEVEAETLDTDMDAGGLRRLLRVDMRQDEPLVVLVVRCPSTGREYILRVPPTITTARHAAAWIAGFDDPDAYHPVKET